MPRLPPSPPGAQQPQYHQSPQKTYLTLSPQRHTPYSAPTSPLLYTSLDYRQATPPLLVKTEFKQEYPTSAAAITTSTTSTRPTRGYPTSPTPTMYDPALQPPVSVYH